MDTLTVDTRSDTVTKPCADMRKAIAEAEVGDDVFGDDPTVNRLQEHVAELLGKEAALFVPTGTMANLLSILSHTWNGRGLELILGDRSHIHLYEQGNVAQFAGVHHRTVSNAPDGTFSIDELLDKVRNQAGDDPHEPRTSLVCVENTHNKCGGTVLPVDWLDKLGETCASLKLPVHCDGARLFNAAIALDKSPAELVRHCSSVSVCLSKGLGCPAGSLVVGTKEFIWRAHRVRKALGGGMRQVGILAAAGLFALKHNVPKLKHDHRFAEELAGAINRVGQGQFVVSKEGTKTNLIFLEIKDPAGRLGDAAHLAERLLQVPDSERRDLAGPGTLVQTSVFSRTVVRLAIHLSLTDQMRAALLRKVPYVLQEALRSA